MPGYRKLGRPSAHRKSMLRNLVTDLFREGRISTTDCRAKEARREAEKLITIAKRGDLHAKRQAMEYIFDEDVVKKLFDEIAPKYADRNGGYTELHTYSSGRQGKGGAFTVRPDPRQNHMERKVTIGGDKQ